MFKYFEKGPKRAKKGQKGPKTYLLLEDELLEDSDSSTLVAAVAAYIVLKYAKKGQRAKKGQKGPKRAKKGQKLTFYLKMNCWKTLTVPH